MSVGGTTAPRLLAAAGGADCKPLPPPPPPLGSAAARSPGAPAYVETGSGNGSAAPPDDVREMHKYYGVVDQHHHHQQHHHQQQQQQHLPAASHQDDYSPRLSSKLAAYAGDPVCEPAVRLLTHMPPGYYQTPAGGGGYAPGVGDYVGYGYGPPTMPHDVMTAAVHIANGASYQHQQVHRSTLKRLDVF